MDWPGPLTNERHQKSQINNLSNEAKMARLISGKALFALGFVCSLCLSPGALGKEYRSAGKPVKLTCIDDNRWVNGSRLELWGSAEKREGWIRIQGGNKVAAAFQQQALKSIWSDPAEEVFMVVVEPDLTARYYDKTGLSPAFESIRWHCSR